MDCISWTSRKLNRRKKRYFYKKQNQILWYAILIVTLLLLISRNYNLTGYIDPFSNFGRITTHLVKPIWVFLNNLLTIFFKEFDYYGLKPYEFTRIAFYSLGFTSLFTILIVITTIKNGRWFCNVLCPVGALFGLISRFSCFKIRLDNLKCIACGDCAAVCKSKCIDLKTLTVESDKCVNCFNCLKICSSSGITYSYQKNNLKRLVKPDRNLRLLIFGVIPIIFGFSNNERKKVIPQKKTTIKEEKNLPVSPPGSQSISRFNSICTSCHLCVSACPTQVIKPSILEYGILGFMQPLLDFKINFCNYECTICGDICTTGAIPPLAVEIKKVTQTGKSIFIEKNCVVYTENTECGACSEVCPTKACFMIPYKSKLKIPEIDNDHCIGCGACEYACPTFPYKAIYVDGFAVHKQAKPLKEENFKSKVAESEDFPF